VCDTEELPQREREALDVLMGQRVAGVILAPVGREHADLRELMAVQSTALVAIDNRLGGHIVDTVLVDNVGGAAALTSHLIAHGHRRIGHVAGILTETSGADRLIGYRSALQTAGLPFRDELVAEGDWSEAGGNAQCLRLLGLDEPPTALMISSSLMAVGALLALRDRGIAVPEHMAVACFDDAPWAPLVEPPLTTLDRQDYALGATAAELILKQLDHPSAGDGMEHLLPMAVVPRRSCGCNT
jgi:DNA-binding LacI/PurR family transcriptional regulator